MRKFFAALTLILLAPTLVHPASAVVQGVNTAANNILNVNATLSGGVTRLRVDATGSTITITGPLDSNSRGLNGITSAVVVGAGLTVTVAATVPTGTRRRVDVQVPGSAPSFLRIGHVGTTTLVGTEVYPTSVWTDDISASASVLVGNPTALVITVQVTTFNDGPAN